LTCERGAGVRADGAWTARQHSRTSSGGEVYTEPIDAGRHASLEVRRLRLVEGAPALPEQKKEISMLPDALSQPVTSPEALQEIVGSPELPALKKQLDFLDAHCRRFIALAPLLFISSSDAAGRCDVAPRGDAPGFVRVLGEKLLAIPERAGNRRTDTMRNILANPHVGLILLIPGVRETLRINGKAGLYRDPHLLEAMTYQGKTPLVAIGVTVEEVFLHCGRALVRSHVWEPETWPQPAERPSAAQIFADHMQLPDVTCAVVEERLEVGYTKALY
jgi:PPOX class probable FMN-dependent enzyme